MKKQVAIETINEFPKEFDLNELFERLLFIDKVEKGIEQANKDQAIKHAKVVEYFKKKWRR